MSLFRPHSHTEESIKLVWENPMAALKDKGWPALGNYKLLSVLLFVVMVGLYVIFANEATLRFFGLLPK